MIKEAYVSYEIAKLLKEKGFAEPLVNYYYTTKGERVSYLMPEEQYLCPTHQMACAWLREVHQLHISIDVYPIYGKVKDEKGRNTCGLLYWNHIASGEWMNGKNNPQQKAFVVSEKSHEQVVEAALKYALDNLIEKQL